MVCQRVDDIVHVRLQDDSRVREVGTVTQTSQRRRVHAVPVSRQQGHELLSAPASEPGRPLRAGEFAAATGLSTGKAKVEGLRSKLKLLAARGWLAGEPGGLFTIPDHAGKSPKPGQ